jgi:hypothetical protein
MTLAKSNVRDHDSLGFLTFKVNHQPFKRV